MKVNKAGIELIKSFESCELEAYLDTLPREPVWTIGYGHTSYAGPPKVVPGMIITEKEAEEILKRDIENFSANVKKYLKRELNDNQFSALVSFAYNVGIGNYRKSTLLKYVNAGKFDKAAKEFMKWIRSGGRVYRGLIRRRKAESQLFMKEEEIKDELKEADKLEKVLDTSVQKGEIRARLRLRESPSTKSKILLVMPMYAEVDIVGKKGNWYEVVYKAPSGHVHGWAYKKYIKT